MDLQLYDSQKHTAQENLKEKHEEYIKENAKQLKLQEARNFQLKLEQQKNLQQIPHLNNNHFHYVEHRTYYNYYQPHCVLYPHQPNKLNFLDQNQLLDFNKMYNHPMNNYNNTYGYNYNNEHFLNSYNNSLSVNVDDGGKTDFNSYFNCNNDVQNSNLLTLSSPDKQKKKQTKTKNKPLYNYNYLNDLNGKSSEDDREDEEDDDYQDEKQVTTTKTGYVDSTTADSESKSTENNVESPECKPVIDSCGKKERMQEINEKFWKENTEELNIGNPLKSQQYKTLNSTYHNKTNEDNSNDYVKNNKYNNNHNNNQPEWQWMKKTVYPTVPSTGKTRTKDKYRVVYTEIQKVELEKEFLYNQYITIQRKSELASFIGLSDRQVKIWFQNRRAKDRKCKRKQEGRSQRGQTIKSGDFDMSSKSMSMLSTNRNEGFYDKNDVIGDYEHQIQPINEYAVFNENLEFNNDINMALNHNNMNAIINNNNPFYYNKFYHPQLDTFDLPYQQQPQQQHKHPIF